MVAAYHLEAGAVCVIDCGTAVTVDVVDADGRHQGGAIMPGKKMMLNALNTKTSRIHASAITNSAQWLGQDTDSCVGAGLLQATLGMIERIAMHYAVHDKRGVSCLITGGDAQDYANGLSIPCRYEPDLVLIGLAIIIGIEV